MAPSTASTPTGVLFEDDPVETLETSLHNDHEQISSPKPAKEYKLRLVWKNIILFAYLHVAAIYGAYLALTSAKLLTLIWGTKHFSSFIIEKLKMIKLYYLYILYF